MRNNYHWDGKIFVAYYFNFTINPSDLTLYHASTAKHCRLFLGTPWQNAFKTLRDFVDVIKFMGMMRNCLLFSFIYVYLYLTVTSHKIYLHRKFTFVMSINSWWIFVTCPYITRICIFNTNSITRTYFSTNGQFHFLRRTQ